MAEEQNPSAPPEEEQQGTTSEDQAEGGNPLSAKPTFQQRLSALLGILRTRIGLAVLLFKAFLAPTRTWQYAWAGAGVLSAAVLLLPLFLSTPHQHTKAPIPLVPAEQSQESDSFPSSAANATPTPPQPVTPAKTQSQSDIPHVSEAASEQKTGFALILTELGQQEEVLKQAIESLPKEVTFAFLPYGKDLKSRIDQVKEQGHEVMLSLPMEPIAYPAHDPGPGALLTGLSEGENTQRLTAFLDQAPDVIGVCPYMGSRFIFSQKDLETLVADLKKRELVLVDTSLSPRSLLRKKRLNWPKIVISTTFSLDNLDTPTQIDNRLKELEDILARGHAVVAFAPAHPLIIQALKDWLKNATQKGFTLRHLKDVTPMVQS